MEISCHFCRTNVITSTVLLTALSDVFQISLLFINIITFISFFAKAYDTKSIFFLVMANLMWLGLFCFLFLLVI